MVFSCTKIRVGEQSEACVISLLPTGQRPQSRTTCNYAMDGILENLPMEISEKRQNQNQQPDSHGFDGNMLQLMILATENS
jgi:hypothetical protein